jgi:hypothetical protein
MYDVTFRSNEQEKNVFKGEKKKSHSGFCHSAFFLVACDMGNKQSSTANWSVDDWAFGTGANAVTIDEVVEETRKIPAKYFGGDAIEKDASMHQMQNDLLAVDEVFKNLFRRKKNRRSIQNQPPPSDEYYYYEEQQSEEFPQPTDSEQNQNYLPPIYANANGLPILEPINNSLKAVENNASKAIWRCSYCAIENKITERVCRRCGQAETRL